MNNTILEVAVQSISAALPSFTFGTNLFASRFPPAPDLAICCYEYEGSSPVEMFNDGGYTLDLPRLQVVCRAPREDYPTAKGTAQDVRNALKNIANTTIGGVYVLRLKPVGSLMPQGADDLDRPRVSLNFQAVTG